MPALLIFMLTPIEYFEMPDECEIELEFKHGRTGRYRCRTDVSYGNFVKEVYDKDDEIIATSLSDLRNMGVTKATLIQRHEIEVL